MPTTEDLLKNLSDIETEAAQRLEATRSLTELDRLNLEIVDGKNSLLAQASSTFTKLRIEQKKPYGQELNRLIERIETLFAATREKILTQNDRSQEIDVTLPVPSAKIGHLSPDSEVIGRMNAFFTYHGYSVAEGPEIETDEYNFEKTNLPKDHPARDLQDTLYVESPEILLRTHTSSIETRILSSFPPPLRFVVPGVCFRNEIVSPSNHAIFYQYQGVLVDKGIGLPNLKATLTEFARYMYGDRVKTRFRTKYYPEVEPGAGMDILCTFCLGSGCRICKGRGWLEILGSGIIHRELLKKCGLDYREWSGFAFGMGLDRIIMTKYGIEDIRDLHGGNLVFV